MDTIYRIATAHGLRYVRAYSMQAAKVRAYTVWGASGRAACTPIGIQAPDIGAHGYRIACGTVDIMPSKAAHADQARPMRGFYEPSQAKRARVDNIAAALIARIMG